MFTTICKRAILANTSINSIMTDAGYGNVHRAYYEKLK